MPKTPSDDHQDIRDAVRALCAEFPDAYHRKIDEARGYPEAFVDALSSQVSGRSVGVYAVNYPASDNYLSSAANGSDDARAHIQDVVAGCPSTKVVLGGYSQGAAVTDIATAAMPACKASAGITLLPTKRTSAMAGSGAAEVNTMAH